MIDTTTTTPTQPLTHARYPAYKDSGVEWLGKIPAHWEVKSLGSLIELKSNKNRPDLQVLSVYRDYGVIPKDSRDDNHNATSLDTSNYKAVEPGYLVVNKMKAWQGSMGISAHEGIVSPAYITCKVISRQVASSFLHQLLRCDSYIGEYNRISYGVRVGQWDMHFEDFKRVPIAIPPLSEQTRIAEFLDRKTAQIDQAIAQKEQLIELLNERRQVMIHRAVTRGLNPDAPMKDSGIDWIGEIPAHWTVKKLKHLGRIVNGYAFNSSEFSVTGVRVMKIANIQTMRIDWSDESFIAEKYFDKLPQYQIKKDDLVFALTRPIISTGIKAAIVDTEEKVLLNQRNAVLKPSSQVQVKWLYYIILDTGFTQAFDHKIDKTGQQPNISSTDIGELSIPYIDFDEQVLIINFLDKMMAQIAGAKLKLANNIQKLQELKSTLINSAVTGKIRV